MRILLDCDSVLSDFPQHAINTVPAIAVLGYTAERLPFQIERDLPPAQYKAASRTYASKGWCLSMPPCKGAKQAVQRLHQLGDVCVVTAPYKSPTWCHERVQWLDKHMGVPYNRVVLTHYKHVVTGDIFVDDRPHHVLKWVEHNPEGVGVIWGVQHMEQNYSNPRVHTLYDWDALISLCGG